MNRRQVFSQLAALLLCGAALSVSASASSQQAHPVHPLPAPLGRMDGLARIAAHLLNAPPLPRPGARLRSLSAGRSTGPAGDTLLHSLSTGNTVVERARSNGKPSAASLAKPGEPALGSAAPTSATSPTVTREQPSRGKVGTQAVFGDDTRERITDTTVYPFSAVCKLYMTYPSGAVYVASGSLIDDQYVLTAGHVVYNHDEGGWAEEILVVPGQDGDYAPFGTASGINVRTFRGWTDVGSYDFDMGLITLDDNVGDSAGWLGFASYGSVKGLTGNLAGYPTDLEEGDAQYYDYGKIKATTKNLAYHKIDSTPGTSGAPIYRIKPRGRYVFAVNSFETATSNAGVRINPSKFDSLVRWIRSGQ